MKTSKIFLRIVKIIAIVLGCLSIFTFAVSIPFLSYKTTDIRRDYGIMGIALTDGNDAATAYIYVTKDELAWYRDTTVFWIKNPERSHMPASHTATLVQIGKEPISEMELYEKLGKHNPEIKKIIPQEKFYELQVSFDRSKYSRNISDEEEQYSTKSWLDENKVDLKWVRDGNIEYALCTVYCEGVSPGNAYDHIWGSYAEPEGYFKLE